MEEIGFYIHISHFCLPKTIMGLSQITVPAQIYIRPVPEIKINSDQGIISLYCI